MSYILGISCFYHDSAAALIENGKIIIAVQEERFTRKKHDDSFPEKSIKFILKEKKIELTDLEAIIFYEKPFLKFERLLETYLAFSPKGFVSFAKSIPIWLKEKLFQKKILIKKLKLINNEFNELKLKFSNHHLSHAASAYYPSPFNNASILTLDGVGEWSTTSIWNAKDNKINKVKSINFPHSIGLLYSAFTYYLGFKVNSGEYKVMGLAPYGKPIFKNLILEKLVNVKEDGSFRLNMKFFNFATGLTMTNKKFDCLFDFNQRSPETELTQIHMDLAASVQNVIEEIVLKIVKNIKKTLPSENLCLAGGVALNCVANGKILKEKIFKNIWIQPASGDAGCSLGAALAYWHMVKDNPKINSTDSMQGSFLGPKYNEEEIEKNLINLEASFKKFDNDEKILFETAKYISNGYAVGWFQGKMEFGPRSLGARSILADPRNPKMQKQLNLKVKFRESFRPFAPAVLNEDTCKYFNLENESPYMLLVANVNEKIRKKINLNKDNKNKEPFGIEMINQMRSDLPAITHVDYSARVQTVNEKYNERFYKLLLKFKEITNCSVLINTSFNVRGEPIVCSVEDAFKCFMGTNLDILVIENFILKKTEQNQNLKLSYKDKYELD